MVLITFWFSLFVIIVLYANYIVAHFMFRRFIEKRGTEWPLEKLLVGVVVSVSMSAMSAVAITGLVVTVFEPFNHTQALFAGSAVIAAASQLWGTRHRIKQPEPAS